MAFLHPKAYICNMNRQRQRYMDWCLNEPQIRQILFPCYLKQIINT